MNFYKFESHSEKDTMHIAQKLAELLHPKDIVILSGELGAGKTKFTEGFLKYFGLENEISSPTFTIVNEYSKNNINIYHFDVYRLEDSSEFYEIGGEEYFDKGICLIEWGEIIHHALPSDYIKVEINKSDANENYRYINITTYGKKYDEILNNLEKNFLA